MKKILLGLLATTMISTAAIAETTFSVFVNPKGNEVLMVTYDNGDTMKFRPIHNNWKYTPADGSRPSWGPDATYFDDFLADKELPVFFSADDIAEANAEAETAEEIIDFLAEVTDLGDFDRSVYKAAYDLQNYDN